MLIIRAWIEQGSSAPLRAEIRLTTNVAAGFERTRTLVQTEDVGAAVQEWMALILRGVAQGE
jgi:hypothetical protein